MRSALIWSLYGVLIIAVAFCNDNKKVKHFKDSSCTSYFDSVCKVVVYEDVTVPPEFPGGAPAWQRFLIKNFRYPEEYNSTDLQSTATASFIVNINGEISCLNIVGKENGNELSPFEKEYMSIFKNIPKWTPGLCDGKAVPVKLHWPVNVHLESE